MHFVSWHAQAADIQMLPPTDYGTPTACSGANQVLLYSADASPGHSGINCLTGLNVTPGTGDLNVANRIFSGNQMTGGNGGMWVGPGQFFGSEGSTGLGLYNGGSWRFSVLNNGWITFGDNGGGQIANWASSEGYNYATFGSGGQQQLILRSDLNAFFFPWTSPGNLYVNGNVNIDNGSVCLKGSCITSWHSLRVDEIVDTTAQSVPSNNWTQSNTVTTERPHDFCILSASQHDGHDSNCEIGSQPNGHWTLQADSGSPGAGVWGTTNCQMTCFNFPGQ
jgi:hypothetical protein